MKCVVAVAAMLMAGVLSAQTTKPVFQVTGSEGTVCTFAKVLGATISIAGNCKTADGNTIVTEPKLTAYSPELLKMTWGFNEVLCVMAINPTSIPAPPGTFLNVPPWSIAWACAGGNGINSTGVVSWP